MQHPRRSKSLSKGSLNGRSTPAARGASPHVQLDSTDSPTLSRLRVSSESTRTNLATTLAQQPASNGRASNEKSRVKLFGRSSSDHERSEISDPRLQSDDTKSGNSFEIMVYPDSLSLRLCLPGSYFSLPLFHRTRLLYRSSTSS